jgi:hypothetical protein
MPGPALAESEQVAVTCCALVRRSSHLYEALARQ